MDLSILSGYSDEVIRSVEKLIDSGKLKSYIRNRYSQEHNIVTDKALYTYINDIKKVFLKNGKTLHRVSFDNSVERAYNALGINIASSKSHGRNIKATNEIRISSLLKKAPGSFLRMVAVHEVAHLKEKNHDKSFYKLCQNMEPDYFQLEFDFRLYLLSLEMEN